MCSVVDVVAFPNSITSICCITCCRPTSCCETNRSNGVRVLTPVTPRNSSASHYWHTDWFSRQTCCDIDYLLSIIIIIVRIIIIGIFSVTYNNMKLSYGRETAHHLPTWRGRLGPPAHSSSGPSGYTYAYGRILNPQQTYVKRAVH